MFDVGCWMLDVWTLDFGLQTPPGAAEPQPSSEDQCNRPDAKSAEKNWTPRTSRILLKMRGSTDLHCDERRDHSRCKDLCAHRVSAVHLPAPYCKLCGLGSVQAIRRHYTSSAPEAERLEARRRPPVALPQPGGEPGILPLPVPPIGGLATPLPAVVWVPGEQARKA
jgi:hypothetical protein